MATLSVPRFVLAGTQAGIGKSLLGIGLAHELRRRGVGLSCCVGGPNLQQALIYRRISGRYAHALDRRLLSPPQLLETLFHASSGADLVMIEGNAGLYDGRPLGSIGGSDAELAALLACPVVLIADALGFNTSLLALIKGYHDFAQDFDVIGVILNRVAAGQGRDHAARKAFNAALEKYSLPLIWGGLPSQPILEQSLPVEVTQLQNRTSLDRQFFVELSNLVREHVDVDELIAGAASAKAIEIDLYDETPQSRRTRIAVSEDTCFNICFQDNLNLLRYFGAEIVSFSLVADQQLPPNIGGLYLLGGYLNDYGQELESNTEIRESILSYINNGGVVYSEGASTAFLCRDFKCTKEGERHIGIGALSARAKPGKPELAFNSLRLTEDSILGSTGDEVRSVNINEFGFFEIENLPTTMKVAEGVVGDLIAEGFAPSKNAVCTPSFLHMGSNPKIAKNLVDAAEASSKI